jgi:hypothetical protein
LSGDFVSTYVLSFPDRSPITVEWVWDVHDGYHIPGRWLITLAQAQDVLLLSAEAPKFTVKGDFEILGSNNNVYTKAQCDGKFALIGSTSTGEPVDLSNYYTKSVADSTFVKVGEESEVDLSDYYTKTQVNALIPAPTDLTPYYTGVQCNGLYQAKGDYVTKIYFRTEMDKACARLKKGLNGLKKNVYNKSETYTKEEIDNLLEKLKMDLQVPQTTPPPEEPEYLVEMEGTPDMTIRGTASNGSELPMARVQTIPSLLEIYGTTNPLTGGYQTWYVDGVAETVAPGRTGSMPDGSWWVQVQYVYIRYIFLAGAQSGTRVINYKMVYDHPGVMHFTLEWTISGTYQQEVQDCWVFTVTPITNCILPVPDYT